jgi:acyl-[acyl-carrier-protein]-phospholipid O-acyltransferase/long-chain-fatty-acid--[acyl-carrier-protein] ligase
MNDSSTYSEVLKVRGVQPFLWMQFLNAFNDNMYKLVVSLLALMVAGKAGSGTYLSLAGFIFIAPFLLFSGYAGQLADRFEKRTVVILTKAIEIAAMIFALFALISGSIEWMLAVLFFTATQAAFFGPAKYGIVPELVAAKHLARANGLLEMSTFVAILLGTIGGTCLVALWSHKPGLIGLVLIAVAIGGTLTSFKIARTPAPIGQRPFSWNPFGDIFAGVNRLTKDRVLMLAVIGTTFFWFLGALFQIVLLLFGKETLHCTEAQTGLLVASLAVGIGVGSIAAGRLSGEKIEPGLVPLGGFGMTLAGFCLAFASHSLVFALIALIALGFTCGLFIVPLNAILQHRPAHDEKGRVIATANFVNTAGVMLASGVVWLLHEFLHVSAANMVGIAAGLTLAAAVCALQLVPNFTVRFLLYLLTHTIYRIRIYGKENVPQRGPALLVANHVSYVDGFLIGACIHRFVRFMVTEGWYDRFARVFSLFHAIRVPAGNRRAIIKAIDLAREELKNGHVVCIFAEGALTLNGNIGEFHRGFENIVEGLDVPVLPVHIGGAWGSIFSLNRRASLWRSLQRLPFPITVSFGKPMSQPSAFDVRQAVSELGADATEHAFSNHDSLAIRFVQAAKRHWFRRAMTDSTGFTLNYGRTLAAALLVAERIRVSHADEKIIGVMLPASTAAGLVNLGVVLAGRIPANLNFTAGREALDSAIEQCALRTIVTSKKFLAKAKIDPRPQMTFAEDLLSFGKTAKLMAYLKGRLYPVSMLLGSAAKASDMAAVLFSSGSTGVPKGVMLSHRNVISNIESVNALFQIDQTDTIAGILPLFHSFGFTYTLWFPLLNGASAAYHAQPLDTKGLGELIEKSKATFLPATPSFCQAYLRGCSQDQFTSLRHVLVGAEKLQPVLAQAFHDKFGLTLLEGYGVTEMAPVISVNIPNRERAGIKQAGCRPGSVGQPVPGVAAKVVHPETGETLSCGQEGLLVVKGPNRMLGYLHRPAETQAAVREGWYVTGDIVIIDASGFIHIVDRQSRFSKIGGEMVPHGKIEEILQSAAPGAPCVVTSVADDRKGERLIAFIVSESATPQEIWNRLMSSDIPKIWIPKPGDIHLLDQLPMLGTGKVDLKAIKKMAMAASRRVGSTLSNRTRYPEPAASDRRLPQCAQAPESIRASAEYVRETQSHGRAPRD